MPDIELYFSDIFNVPPDIIEEYGAFNVSLITDLPLFIDPFLLFNSPKDEYQELHNQMITYLKFLRDKSSGGELHPGLLSSWYRFSEVKQNWLGFCESGNTGRGLGIKFAGALNKNLHALFRDFGGETVTKGSHLEKLCLIEKGVGKDTISDFTTNLTKEYLLKYTEAFAKEHIADHLRKKRAVNKVRFNYTTETWEHGVFDLPFYQNDYVLLTPKDILTKDDVWINKRGLYDEFYQIPDAIGNAELREQINNYFTSLLPKVPKKEDVESAINKVALKYPEIIDYYIKHKEENGDKAVDKSSLKVFESKNLYIRQFGELIYSLNQQTDFYKCAGNTADEACQRIEFLKNVIENKGGYKIFYYKGKPIRKEEDVQILYRLTWFATPSDVSREVNDGRGPVDFKISRGSKDKTLVEFKLASNPQIKRNLEKQLEIYQKASDAQVGYKVIFYFTALERAKVDRILRELQLTGHPNVILIDARADNKPSGSKA